MPKRLLKPSWWRLHGAGVLAAWIGLAILFLLVLGVNNKANTAKTRADLNAQVLVQREEARKDRTKQFCDYAYTQQDNARMDALKSYKQLPALAKFFNGDPKELQEAAKKNLLDQLSDEGKGGRYSNKRLPNYCPQSKVPTPIPAELQPPRKQV